MKAYLRNSLSNSCLCSIQLGSCPTPSQAETEGLLSEKAKETASALGTTDSIETWAFLLRTRRIKEHLHAQRQSPSPALRLCSPNAGSQEEMEVFPLRNLTRIGGKT